MRSRRPSPEHEQAVARRLALLSAELAAVRRDTGQGETPEHQPDVTTTTQWPWDQHTRIRSSEGPSDPRSEGSSDAGPASGLSGEVSAPVEIPAWTLPVPGRHAARRELLVSLVPAGLRGRLGLQPTHLALVAVAVAVALAWTTWWAVSSRPETDVVAPVRPDASPVSAPTGDGGEAGKTTTADPSALAPVAGRTGGETEVVVDVAGRVRRPGLVVLPLGSRVNDALEAAGGARRGVVLSGLNLARVLVDGEQILVGVRPPSGPAVPGQPAPAPPPGAPAGLVNLNTADQALLETLPGVGPVTAGAIVAWRTENGGFSSVEELLEVDGIGEVTLADLAPLVSV